MPDGLSEQAKRKMVGRYPDWIKRFDVDEYYQNRPMIEKLYEERQLALAINLDYEEATKEMSDQIHDLVLKNQLLTSKFSETKRQSVAAFPLSLLVAILMGIGVNIVTDKPYAWVGWVMIGACILLEIIVFVVTRQRE